MITSPQRSEILRFGVFEADPIAGELRKNGVRVKLQQQPFQVLVCLLERSREVVTREKLIGKLWPNGTVVEYEHSLGTAVNKIRQALGDSADNPRFVETLPRRGYRFLLPVEGIVRPAEARPRQDAERALQPGNTISHYRITEKIGEGGMGIVYKAEDIKLKRPVALKFLAPHLLRDEEGRKRLLREAQAAAALDHPNICTVHEIDEADGRTFIVMAFLEGRPLSERIQEGPLKLPEALSIAIQMAEGLEAAHEKGIVHRDIKPDNVMLMKGSRGLVKLMDFGLAQLAESSKLTREGTTMGTPIYMSPEQALGEATDQRSDVWGLGVVLYEIVAGKPPFGGEVDQAVIYSIANEQHEPLTGVRTGVPKDLERIVDKCLAKEADERYQHVTDLLVDLQACRRGLEPQTDKVDPKPERVKRTSPALVGGAVAAAIILTVAGWWWMGSGRVQPGPRPQRLTRLTSDSGLTFQPAISANGELLAYASDRGGKGNTDIWVQQLGGEPVQLTHDEAEDFAPTFSPDGRQIAFTSRRDGLGIYVVSALGGSPPRLVVERGMNSRFSPDGKRIAYFTPWSGTNVPAKAYVVSSTGGTPRQVQPDFFQTWTSIWSPDGKYLLFQGRPRFTETANPDEDWWVVSSEGGVAQKTGAIEALRSQGLGPQGLGRPGPSQWRAE